MSSVASPKKAAEMLPSKPSKSQVVSSIRSSQSVQVHRQRVLKDLGQQNIEPLKKQPLSQIDSNVLHNRTLKHSQSTPTAKKEPTAAVKAMQKFNKQHSSVSTAGPTPDQLRLRITTLEEENRRLRNHVVSAEDAIGCYKGFIRRNSVCENNNSGPSEISCQTADTATARSDDSVRAALIAAQNKIARLGEVGKKKDEQCARLQKEVDRLNSALILIKKNEERSLDAVVVPKTNNGDESSVDCGHKRHDDDDASVGALSAAQIDQQHLSVAAVDVVQATKLLQELRRIQQEDSGFIQDQLHQYREYLVRCRNQLTTVVFKAGQRGPPSSSSGNNEVHRNEVLSLKEQLTHKQQEIVEMKAGHEIRVSSLQGEIQRATVRFNQVAEESKTGKTQLEDMQRRLDDALKCSADAVSTATAAEKEKLQALEHQLRSASGLFAELQKKQENEIKAVKSSAHVKDLCKIASLREITIQRDRLISDAKYYKESINVLSFSIKAAERALRDLNSPVVGKLEEGRVRRLRDLEDASALRASAIEQRSADVCAVNIAELEGFLEKAAVKLRAAEEDRSNAAKSLKEMLQC